MRRAKWECDSAKDLASTGVSECQKLAACISVCLSGSSCFHSAAKPPAVTHSSATPKMATLEAASRQADIPSVGPSVKRRPQQLFDTTPTCCGVRVRPLLSAAGTGSTERSRLSADTLCPESCHFPCFTVVYYLRHTRSLCRDTV